MTKPAHHANPRWPGFLLAALVAALVILFGAGTASAATANAAQTRVGAHTLAAQVVVGPHVGIGAGQRLGNDPPAYDFALATGVAAKTGGAIPGIIYRGGGKSPSNFRLREGEDALSFRGSMSNPLSPGSPVLRPGKDYVGIDTSRLPAGSVVPDGVVGSARTPPGHVSVYLNDPDLLKAAIIESGRFPK